MRSTPPTGALTPIAGSPFSAGAAPRSVALDPSGKFAYVANQTSNNVSGYTINSTTVVAHGDRRFALPRRTVSDIRGHHGLQYTAYDHRRLRLACYTLAAES